MEPRNRPAAQSKLLHFVRELQVLGIQGNVKPQQHVGEMSGEILTQVTGEMGETGVRQSPVSLAISNDSRVW